MDLVRFGVYWVNLDPTIGNEINKTRPAIIISPDEVNKYLGTVLICPLTSTLKSYPTRVRVTIGDKQGDAALDHLRSIDKSRIVSQMDMLSKEDATRLIDTAIELLKI